MMKEILKWNEERALLNDFKPSLEFNMLLEEVLELRIKDKKDIKDLISCINSTISSISDNEVSEISIKEMADAYIDAVIIAIGSLGKLIKYINMLNKDNLDIDDIEKIIKAGFKAVIKANNQKPAVKDSSGKIIKGDSFKEPSIPLTLGEIENDYV